MKDAGYENSGAEVAGEHRFLTGFNWGNALGRDMSSAISLPPPNPRESSARTPSAWRSHFTPGTSFFASMELGGYFDGGIPCRYSRRVLGFQLAAWSLLWIPVEPLAGFPAGGKYRR